jgi:hypothetical protein
LGCPALLWLRASRSLSLVTSTSHALPQQACSRHFTPIPTQTEEGATKLSCFDLYGSVSPTAGKVMIEPRLGMIKRLAAHALVRPKIRSTWTAE